MKLNNISKSLICFITYSCLFSFGSKARIRDDMEVGSNAIVSESNVSIIANVVTFRRDLILRNSNLEIIADRIEIYGNFSKDQNSTLTIRPMTGNRALFRIYQNNAR